jgi:DNA-binding CsgD family transcriptional regulator
VAGSHPEVPGMFPDADRACAAAGCPTCKATVAPVPVHALDPIMRDFGVEGDETPCEVAARLEAATRRLARELAEARSKLKEQTFRAVDKHAALTLLTLREREVAERLVAGARPTEIAKQMGISMHTVRNFLKFAFRKLGVRSQVELVAVLNGTRAEVQRG